MIAKAIYSIVLAIILFRCDLKPIDYNKRTHKSSYIRAGSTQTGVPRKSTQEGQ